MAKEVIRFKGLSLNKDEQSASHGELALCANVELHDGALRPSVLDGSMVQHEEDGIMVDSTLASTLRYVHETPSYRHFIGERTWNNKVSLYWYNEDGTIGSSTAIHEFDPDEKIISIESVGNTLVVMADDGVHYVLWTNNGYKYLGTQIPFVELQFRPSANKQGSYDTSSIPNAPSGVGSYYAYRMLAVKPSDGVGTRRNSETGKLEVYVKNDYKSAITESIWALINQTNDTITRDGHFCAPFIIRYCYRMYDGSMIMHSAPVYMDVALPRCYRVYHQCVGNQEGADNIEIFDNGITIRDGDLEFVVPADTTLFCYQPNNVSIMYSTIGQDTNNSALLSLKEDWGDIVKSIDIFVSPLLAREKTGELILTANKENTDTYNSEDYGVRDSFRSMLYTEHRFRRGVDNPVYYKVNLKFDIPLADENTYLQKLKDCSTLYKIKSLNLEADTIGTNGTFVELDYSKDYIPNITSQELMKDDYLSHNSLLPINSKSGMYVYNHRLNLYNMRQKLFEGFHIRTQINFTPYGAWRINEIIIELSTENGTKYVRKEHVFPFSDVSNRDMEHSLLFYPDSRATKMMIRYNDNYLITIPMEPCNFLNGAMATKYFFDSIQGDYDSSTIFPENQNIDPMPNKILTSEVDNPYFFPVEGRNSVGNGTIKGIAAVTRALSQGQVGDHDLIAFSTDGIWVMKVASTGLYSAIHNISREVCSNPKSICQLDQSVVFATERNLSRFVESDVLNISEVLDGPIPAWSTLLPTLVAAFPSNGTAAQQTINKLLAQMPPAVQLFNQGSVFYDYASKRIVVLPAANASGVVDAGVAMVFSIRDEAWSTMAIPAIKSVIPGYPSPFVQLGDGKVMILDKTYGYAGGVDTPTVPGLIITRTLTFSDTMDVIRGYTQYADSAIAPTMYVFGSNDQRSWQSLGTSNRWFYNYMPGRPYRFFRIAVYMQMKPSEEYQQVEMEAINKYAKL